MNVFPLTLCLGLCCAALCLGSAGCRARAFATREDVESGELDPRKTEIARTLLGPQEPPPSAETLSRQPPPTHVAGYQSTTTPTSEEDLSPQTVGAMVDIYETAQTINSLATGRDGFNLGVNLENQGSQTRSALTGVRGVVHYKLGEFGPAVDRFTEAIQADPQNGRLWSARAQAFYAMSQYEYALADCRQALGLDPANPDAWLLQGQIYQLGGDYETALKSLDEAQRYRRDHADTSILRAETLSLLGRHDEAIASARHAVELRPDDPATTTALGFAYAEGGHVEQAVRAFSTVLREHPEHARAYFGRGSLALLAGAFDSAEADLNRAVELAPEFGNARHRRAMVRVQTGRIDEALADCQSALADSHVEPYIYNTLGTIYLSKELPEQAAAAFTELLSHVPDDATALANRSHALAQMGQFDRAIADAQQALVIQPRLGDACNHLANAYHLAGRSSEALAAYDRALELNPEHPHYRVNRGQARLKAGLTSGAIDDFTQVIDSTPASPIVAVAHWRRGEAYAALGDSGRAASDRQRGQQLDQRVTDLTPLIEP